MRKAVFVSLIALMLAVCSLAHAQSKSDQNAVGTWSGTWIGDSKGKFEMTITKAPDGKLSATMTSTPDQQESTTWRSKMVEANGDKLTINFEDTNGDLDATLEGVIDGSSIKGDYSVRANGDQVDAGTFQGTRN